MGYSNTSIQKYIDASQLFHWATASHYALWFTGSDKRHRRTETILPRLARRYEDKQTRDRSLFATKFGKRMVYTCPRRVRNPDMLYKVEHGLGCTECLIRFWWSNVNAEIIEERHFFGCGSVPDLGLLYPNGKMALVEFSTHNDFLYYNRMKSKLVAYRKHLWGINEKFRVDSFIIFVLDVPRDKVQRFVSEIVPTNLPVFFTDYETFRSVPIGQQLFAPIYIWGKDGITYPLTGDAQL